MLELSSDKDLEKCPSRRNFIWLKKLEDLIFYVVQVLF